MSIKAFSHLLLLLQVLILLFSQFLKFWGFLALIRSKFELAKCHKERRATKWRKRRCIVLKDSDKKRSRRKGIRKKKGKPLLRPRPLIKHYTMQVTSAGTTHGIKAFCMVLKYNGNTHLEPLRILLRTNQQYDIYIGRSCKLLKNMKKFQVLVQCNSCDLAWL